MVPTANLAFALFAAVLNFMALAASRGAFFKFETHDEQQWVTLVFVRLPA